MALTVLYYRPNKGVCKLYDNTCREQWESCREQVWFLSFLMHGLFWKKILLSSNNCMKSINWFSTNTSSGPYGILFILSKGYSVGNWLSLSLPFWKFNCISYMCRPTVKIVWFNSYKVTACYRTQNFHFKINVDSCREQRMSSSQHFEPVATLEKMLFFI